MNRELTCIECPRSCVLSVTAENGRVVAVRGHGCPKGEVYARAEIERPLRILTGTVAARGLALKMIPVRTDTPIPKAQLLAAAAQIKKIRITTPVRAGEIIVRDFIEPVVNLIATRDSGEALPRDEFRQG